MWGILNPLNINLITLQKVSVKFNLSLQVSCCQLILNEARVQYFESLTVVFVGLSTGLLCSYPDRE